MLNKIKNNIFLVAAVIAGIAAYALTTILKTAKHSADYNSLENDLKKIENESEAKLGLSRLERIELYEKVISEPDSNQRFNMLIEHYKRKRQELDNRNGY